MNESLSDVTADDASLLAASQAGDVAAFGQLIERYHNLVCAIAYSRVGDRVASEDIAQDTFLAAWHGLAGLRDPEKLRPWLCGIARNVAGKTLRSRRREPVEDVADLEGQLAGDPGPLTAMLSKELEQTVWAALERLPATYREPLVLFYREQQSIKQVALGLGLSEETAKQRLSRGRHSLRENIGELVEQTLQAGRPRKAAAAAVLAAILASRSSMAVAATHVPRRGFLLAGAGVCLAVGIVIVVGASRSATPAHAPASGDDRAVIAQLRRAHAAWRASKSVRPCELRGSVSRTDRSAIARATVALVEHSWQATSLDPTIVETDARGRWTMPPVPSGTYTLSVSAAGARATTRVVTCAGIVDHSFELPPTGAQLRGSISDVGGGPIAGVTVWVLDPQRPSTVFVTRSDARGTYELVVPPGLYTTLSTHPDYTLDVRPLTLGAAGSREDITLLPGGSIEGTVVDNTGAPIPGAKISTVAPSLSPHDAPLRWQMAAVYGALVPTVTDANGRFRLRGLPPGTVRLAARAGALTTTSPPSFDLTLAEQATGAKIALATGRTIAGFVVARGDRHGVHGVQLVAVREDAPLAMPIVATSDGAGYFEIAGLTAGKYRMTALGPGYAPYVANEPLALADHDLADTLIVLDRGVALRGRIDPPDPASIKLAPTATSIRDYLTAAMARADVDDRGNFTFAAVAPGDYVIAATSFDRGSERPVRVATTDQTVPPMTLAPRPAITGRVVDDTGAKLAGVLVSATPSRSQDPFAAMHSTVRTDEHGAFTIVGVHPGRHQLRVFDAKGQRPWAHAAKRPFKARVVDVPKTGSVSEQLEVASRGARITGTVVGPDGEPVADSWIEARARDAHRRPELFTSPPVLTDAAGTFSIDGLYGAELVVEASGTDGKQRAVATAAPGAHVRLALQPIATLTGKVTHDGKPVSAFEVRLRHTATEATRRVTGAAGAFSLPAMAGEYELVVTADAGYARRSITIGSPASVEIVLVPWSSVRGRIVGTDGTPWANASVLVDDAVEPALPRTDESGNFTIDRMVAGRNELAVHDGRGDFFVLEFELAPGQRLDLQTIGPRASLWRQTTASSSADLGLQIYVSVDRPTAAQLAAVTTDPLLAYRAGNDPNAALWIVKVDPNGHAARAGLRAGDRVAAVGMTKVDGGESSVEMGMSLAQPWRSKGRAVPWAIVRDGRELKVDVLVPTRP